MIDFNDEIEENEDEHLIYPEETFEFYVNPEDDNKRIDVIIAEKLTGFTRSRVQKLISSGNVNINNNIVFNKNYRVSINELIKVLIPPPDEFEIKAENIPLNIIYEDNDIVIVDKPKGMVVHPAPGHYSGTLVNALMYHCGNDLSGINGVIRPGIVHRIDKDTSGVLAVCKNDFSHSYLANLLSKHDITRKYYCLVFGILSVKEGTVNASIGRHNTDRKKMSVNSKNGKNAITHYKVVDEYKNKYSLLECQLETGRTHQIRVHMASIHHPLVGDTVYGPEKQPFKVQGQMLHAAVLGFVHPESGNYMEFKSALPKQFVDICSSISDNNNEIVMRIQNYLNDYNAPFV